MVVHRFSRELCIISVSVLNVRAVAPVRSSLLSEGDVFNFTPWAEELVKSLRCSLLWVLLVLRQRHSGEEKGSAVLVEAADSSHVFFAARMP